MFSEQISKLNYKTIIETCFFKIKLLKRQPLILGLNLKIKKLNKTERELESPEKSQQSGLL